VNEVILKQARDTIAQALGPTRPTAAFVLGSGWGAIDNLSATRSLLPYSRIPGLGAPQVPGHAGELLLMEATSQPILIFSGRRHWYEGLGWEPVAIPVYTCATLSIPSLLLTNAAGGIRHDLAPGSFMIVEDHINAMGTSPLIGPVIPAFGPRFPDQSAIYDRDLQALLENALRTNGETPARGVYAAVSGPAYETPAEVRALRASGADAVGMSTVPEATLANAAGLRVAALSFITNTAAGLAAGRLSHDEVVSRTRAKRQTMAAVLSRYAEQLTRPPSQQESTR
jgi:purine-nucleoside phosphorylase